LGIKPGFTPLSSTLKGLSQSLWIGAGMALQVQEDEVMWMTAGGKTVRIVARDIRVIGRNTQGVRLIEPGEGGRVVAVARLAKKQDEGTAETEG
jgi:DNA gyrase subunit A